MVFLQKKVEVDLHYRPFHRDSHPLLVPVLQKKKGPKVSKTANKERLENHEDKTLTYTIYMAFFLIGPPLKMSLDCPPKIANFGSSRHP